MWHILSGSFTFKGNSFSISQKLVNVFLIVYFCVVSCHNTKLIIFNGFPMPEESDEKYLRWFNFVFSRSYVIFVNWIMCQLWI